MLKLPSKERIIVGIVIGVLIGYSVFVSFKYIEGKQIMLVEKERVNEVNGCLKNQAACRLIIQDYSKVDK